MSSHRVSAQGGQEIEHDRVLVMPRGDLAGFLEQFRAAQLGMLALQSVDHVVVEPDHGELDLADDAVLVIARVADDGAPVGGARQVVRRAFQQLRAAEIVIVVGVEIRLRLGPQAVHAIEVQRGRADIRNFLCIIHHLAEAGRRIQRDVVVEELAEEDHADRDGCGFLLRAARIHRPARPADGRQAGLPDIAGGQIREHAPETVLSSAALIVAATVTLHSCKRHHAVMCTGTHVILLWLTEQ
ncbi:hypothetical protein PF049_10995 [Erythrobacteraceae bacterium WH01K]|nr:hypothetical protein PF049_10995 [Erythrobacteraceae bacterium WH01K]